MPVEVDSGNFQVRVRFVDENGNYSHQYTTVSVDINAFKLVALSNGNNEFLSSGIYDINDENNTLIKLMRPDYLYFQSIVTAFDDDTQLVYILTVYNAELQSNLIGFSSVNLDGNIGVDLNLVNGEGISEFYSMCYRSQNTFYVNAYQNGTMNLYSLTLSENTGTLNLIKSDFSYNLPGMIYKNGNLYGIKMYEAPYLIQFDPETGDVAQDENGNIITLLTFADNTISANYVYGMCDNSTEETKFVTFIEYSDTDTEGSNRGIFEIDFNTKTMTILYDNFSGNMASISKGVVGEETLLTGFTSHDQNSSTLSPGAFYKLSDKSLLMQVGSQILDNSSAFTYNSQDGYTYYIANRAYGYGPNRLSLFKVDLNSEDQSIEEISLTGDLYVPPDIIYLNLTGNDNIGDGGNDMYDNGNILVTNLNLSSQSPIQYTHTQGAETHAMDGVIVDGTTSFGAESSYFTNVYPGLFVLGAININVETFGVVGFTGADGSGQIYVNRFNVNSESSTYTCYLKVIYGAGDPSIHQVIIIPGIHFEINQTYNNNTDRCQQEISVSGQPSVYYMMFARGTGDKIDDSIISSMVSQFLGNVDPANLQNTLNNLNEFYGDIMALMPDVFVFTDTGNQSNNSAIEINGSVGIETPLSMTYSSDNNRLYVNDEANLYKIDGDEGFNNAVVTKISSIPFPIIGMAYNDNVIYMTSFWSSFLIKVDPSTGEIINEGGEKFDPIISIDDQVEGFQIISITFMNGELYGLIYILNGPNIIVKINTTTGVATYIGDTPNSSAGYEDIAIIRAQS